MSRSKYYQNRIWERPSCQQICSSCSQGIASLGSTTEQHMQHGDF